MRHKPDIWYHTTISNVDHLYPPFASHSVLILHKKQPQTSTLKLRLILLVKLKPAFEPEPKLVVDQNTREQAGKQLSTRAENITTSFWLLTDEVQLNPGTVLVSLASSHSANSFPLPQNYTDTPLLFILRLLSLFLAFTLAR